MATVTSNMSLVKWDDLNDVFSHSQLASNFQTIDQHDHTVGKGARLPAGSLGPLSVLTGNLQNASVTTPKLQDGSVTNAKLADHSVTAGKLSGFQGKTVTTGSITAGSTTNVTLTWDAAFASSSYAVVVSLLQTTDSGNDSTLRIVKIVSQSTTNIVVAVKNYSAGSLTGTLNAIAKA